MPSPRTHSHSRISRVAQAQCPASLFFFLTYNILHCIPFISQFDPNEQLFKGASSHPCPLAGRMTATPPLRAALSALYRYSEAPRESHPPPSEWQAQLLPLPVWRPYSDLAERAWGQTPVLHMQLHRTKAVPQRRPRLSNLLITSFSSAPLPG